MAPALQGLTRCFLRFGRVIPSGAEGSNGDARSPRLAFARQENLASSTPLGRTSFSTIDPILHASYRDRDVGKVCLATAGLRAVVGERHFRDGGSFPLTGRCRGLMG